MNALHSAATVEQYTPADIVEAARATLGGRIALDPASSEFANRVVRAETIFTGPPDGQDGLAEPWFGPLFVNPPGKCATNPGGQAAWWNKLVTEVELHRFDAIFLGFSLELLQTAQTSGALVHPLDFRVCVPKKRIKFERRARDILPEEEAKNRKLREATCGLSDTRMLKEVAKHDKWLAHVREQAVLDGRVKGASPTHGNIIVCVTTDPAVRGRFKDEFSRFGYVS